MGSGRGRHRTTSGPPHLQKFALVSLGRLTCLVKEPMP